MAATTLCWDFDGTLWDNQTSCVQQLTFALRVLNIEADAEQLWQQAHEGNPARHVFEFLSGRANVGKLARKPIESWRFLRDMHEAAMQGTRPFPVLDAWDFGAEHLRNVIVSTNKKRVIRGTFERHGITEPVDYQCGKRSKKKKLSRLVAKHDGADQLLLISDTTGDLRFADELGIPTIGAGWGLHGGERLREARCDHLRCVVDRPQDLLSCLRDLTAPADDPEPMLAPTRASPSLDAPGEPTP